ncbi:hypothetical protein [Altererythrobacter fulvus]|uniref:hypothetical protein n=1 Tax=Caenibius fulvus TaxID=2126012 RepID=UPI0030192830
MAGRHRNSKRGPKGTGKPSPDKDRAAHAAARGVGRKSLSKLSRDDLSAEEIRAAVLAMHNETDRGSAIMGAALVELGVKHVCWALVRNLDATDALFEGVGAPFGTFSAKTLAIYALGYCDKERKREIDAIREIRNQFSHALRVIDFTLPEVGAACKLLKKHHMEPKMANALLPAKSENRVTFEAACLSITISLIDKGKEIAEERKRRLDQIIADLKESRPNIRD